MPPLLRRWKRYAWIALTFLPFISNAQTPASLVGKEYLSPDGRYLRFLSTTQAFFNADTVQYRIQEDTLHLTATYTWIGESRHQFTQEFIYGLSLLPNGFTLKALSLPGGIKKEELLQFIDRTTLVPDRSSFKSFFFTKREYLTWGGETDTTGTLVRSDSVYTVTTLSLYKNRTFVIEVGHLQVHRSPEGTTEQYSKLSKKRRKLSKSDFAQKLAIIRQSHPLFMQDEPCLATYLYYSFEYNSGKRNHSYTRCWLTFFESPIAAWDRETN